MKLALPLLLLTLALCCPDADAEVCRFLERGAKRFLLDPKPFGRHGPAAMLAPGTFSQDVQEVKTCTNQIPFPGRLKIYKVVRNIIAKCNN